MQNNTVYRDDLKFAYEQSVNAYQQHVQRYGTWMNMYAIITGALLVAFYNLYAIEKSSNELLIYLIAVLGWISSLCWYGCVKGHYEWMKSFMSIVKHNEKVYFSKYGDDMLFVYSKVQINRSAYKPKDNYIPGFLSTQKITLFFITIVALAWPLGIFILDGNSIVAWLLVALTVILHIYVVVIQKLYRSFKIKHIIQSFFLYPVRYFHSTISPNEIIKKI